MKKYSIIFLLLPLLGFCQTDTLSIYFEIGKFEANTVELEKLKANKSDWEKVDIISYTDYLGSAELNNRLSLNRSFEIRARLVQFGLNTETLGLVEGRGIIGETLDSKEGIQENRRTDVIITYNLIEIEDTIWSQESGEDNISSIRIERKNSQKELKEEITTAEVGDHLVLSEMIFLPGQHYLTEESTPSYQELFQLLKDNKTLKIKIEGHICCKLDDEDGLDLETNKYNLSEARAKYIYDILIEDGIDANRLSYEGFARDKPLYPDEKTEEEKIANRRVEIRIIAK